MIVRVEEGDFQVRRQRIKVLGGGAVALFDLGALRDPATGGWATEEAAAARTRMAEAVEEARCRSDQGGVAVDFGVVRTSNDLYLVFGVVGTLRPWWRSFLWRFPYADAQREMQRFPGQTLSGLLEREGVLGQATVAFERDAALGVLERDLPRGQGAHFITASPSSGETGSAEQRAARPVVGDEFDLAPHGAPPTRFRVVRTFPVTFDAVRVDAEYEVIRFSV